VTVPYSPEFRERESNQALITSLASTQPAGGEAGKIIEGPLTKDSVDRLVSSVDTFRRTLAKAMSSRDFWPILLLIAAFVFLTDIFIRRVTVHFYWVLPALTQAFHRLRGIQQAEVADERLARLRNRKAAVSNQLDERRAAARFEPVMDESGGETRHAEQIIADAAGGSSQTSPPPTSPQKSHSPQTEEETYTERLLKAKKRAQGP